MWKYVLPPVVVVASLWLLMSSATTIYLHWIERSHERVLDVNVASIQAANELQRALRRIERNVAASDWNSPAEPIWRDDLAQLQQCQRELLSLAGELQTRNKAEALVPLLNQLEQRLQALDRTASPAAGAGATGDDTVTGLVAAVRQSAEQLSAINLGIIHLHQHLIDQAAEHRLRVSRLMHALRITLLCTGPLVGVWLGWQMSSRLQKSVGRIAVTLRQINGQERDLGKITLEADGPLADVQQQAEAIVSRLQQTHHELEMARSEIIRSERLASVGELAAGVAHEIRNPLTSVKLLLQHAARQGDPVPMSHDKLRLILDEVGRMESVVQGLLDLSRAQPLARSVHKLSQTIRQAVQLVEGRARAQNVSIALQLLEGAEIDGDADQLRQVFANLLINAIQAMPDGGEVTVAMSIEPDSVRVGITDEGSGIPAEVLPRLFEPFATSKVRGTGLGLAISRRIIDQHAGTLVGANRSEGGAVFTVDLPTVRPAVSSPRAKAVAS